MIQNAKDERKYKNSIVSILVLGVCLILMVNIGLGVHTCSSLEPDGNYYLFLFVVILFNY